MASSSDKRIRRKVRRSYLISTVSIALVLFILGAVSYVTLSAVNAAEALRERVIISVEIADELTKDDKRDMLSALRSREEVADVDYTSKEESSRMRSSAANLSSTSTPYSTKIPSTIASSSPSTTITSMPQVSRGSPQTLEL